MTNAAKAGYLELHLIHLMAPNNINRDDQGLPKDVTFGGVRRDRVSSQTWKRAMRVYTHEHGLLDEADQAYRSKKSGQLVYGYLRPLLAEQFTEGQIGALAAAAVGSLTGDEGEDGKLKTLFLMGRTEAAAVARTLAAYAATPEGQAVIAGFKDVQFTDAPVSGEDTVAPVKKAKGAKAKKGAEEESPESAWKAFGQKFRNELQRAALSAPSLEVSVYGRMVAANTDLRVDGALEVAHAVGTHRTVNQYDYFTGMDDLDLKGGAGMIEQTQFTSSVLYRYLALDIEALWQNLKALPDEERTAAILRAAQAIVTSAVKSMPSGKRRSFANNTLPTYVLGVASATHQACSLAEAFSQAITHDDLVGASVAYLEHYRAHVSAAFPRTEQAFALSVTPRTLRMVGPDGSEHAPVATDVPSIDALTESLMGALRDQLSARQAAERRAQDAGA